MSDCIFCKIISGEMTSFTIYEDEEFKVILDRFPSSLGHLLVLPKKHIENIFEMPIEKGGRLFELVIKMASVMKKEFRCDGVNILQNNGEAAGQSVNHFHVHIIPRYNNDKVLKQWDPICPNEPELEAMRRKLVDAITL